ncbi:MAG: cytochrome c [Bacteroidota bacterium]
MKKLVLLYSIFIAGGFAFFTQETELQKSMQRGRELYTDFCVTCHLPNGEGVAGVFPPLAKSDYLLHNRVQSIKAVKYGQQGKITVNGKTYNTTMAPMGLTDEEVADVMNYILNSWGNTDGKMVTVEEVKQLKKD